MNVIPLIKKGLHLVNSVGKTAYRICYEIPVRYYKCRINPSINEFSHDLTFRYTFDGYFPAIMRTEPEKAAKIYSRVIRFDDEMLPLLDRFEQKYWPVTVIQYGLLNYNFYLTYGENQYKQLCLKVCDWLIDHIAASGMWEHHITYLCKVVDEEILPPYGSAMVQGEAISLLVRGYHLTKDAKYLQCAEKALAPYQIPVADGGLLESFMGMPFYEEYPTKTPSLVLNGFMYSLFGLYDLSCMDCFGCDTAKKLFDDGIQTLEKILPMYEGGYCSRYDLAYITAAPRKGHKDPFYHPIHVNQLIALNSIHRSKVFEHYIQEWK